MRESGRFVFRLEMVDVPDRLGRTIKVKQCFPKVVMLYRTNDRPLNYKDAG